MKSSQCKQIAAHLKRHGAITPLVALRRYGCLRLGARIWDLKQRGMSIVARPKKVRTKAGTAVVAEYRLA